MPQNRDKNSQKNQLWQTLAGDMIMPPTNGSIE